MKIRNGFVSNSSSSSFLMVGMKFDWPKKASDFISTVMNMTPEEVFQEVLKDSNRPNISDRDVEDYCYDWLYDLSFEENGFDVAFNSEQESCIIVGKDLLSTYNCEIKGCDPDIKDEIAIVEKIRENMGVDIPIQLYIGSILG